MNKLIKAKGFTILELIFAITISLAIIGATVSMINVFAKTATSGRNEAVAQSEIRITVDTISNVTKGASATFIMPKDALDKTLTKAWNYIGVKESDGKSEIVHYIYDEDEKKHNERILCDAREKITYKIFLDKKFSEEEKLLDFSIVTFREGVEISRVNSKVEALNSLQLIDRSGLVELEAGQSLAYRSSERKLAEDVIANVVLVVDTSGTMRDQMDGSIIGSGPLRIEVLYEAATILLNKLNEADTDAVNLAVVSFNSSAVNSRRSPETLDKTVELKKFYPLKDNIDKFRLLFDANLWLPEGERPEYMKGVLQQIIEGGHTNTAEGLRVGNVLLEQQNAKLRSETDKMVKNYLVLLIDGDASTVSRYSPTPTDPDDDTKKYTGAEMDALEIYKGDALDLGKGSELYNHIVIDTREAWDAEDWSKPKSKAAAKFFANKYLKGGVKSYLVGILDEDTFKVLDYLLGSDSLGIEKAYRADNAEDMKAVFGEIGKGIIDDLWFVIGPEY